MYGVAYTVAPPMAERTNYLRCVIDKYRDEFENVETSTTSKLTLNGDR